MSDPTSSPPPDPSHHDAREFHVVGVGASAGGLEALEQLFKTLSPDTGMAFVVVQHLSPDFKSHMQQLLARHTTMTIHRVENGMSVEPNSVYLIPPKMEMVISGGNLLLTAKSKERTLSHPIDQFLRSLATDRGRYSIGVILSGTGSDGSRGIRDIEDAGGLVLAQDTGTARFDGMPINAQATGIVHAVLPPAAIADALERYVKEGLTPETVAQQDLLPVAEAGMEQIFRLLNRQHGIDFSHYKSSTVGRRIQRRIDMMSMDSLEQYLPRLEEDPSELNELYKDLLIGVTRFFRNPEAFEVLEQQILPDLVSHAGSHRPIRVWIAGCASGEEAYSIAILLDEELRRRGRKVEVKIFATDVHQVSLSIAARGVYPEESLDEMSPDRRTRYFRRQRDGYHVTRELRRYVVFAPHNVISDAPFTQMDLVTCRNLLIYFQPNAQRKALSLFHFALRAGGALLLGPSESPGDLADEFQVVDKKWRVYRKVRDVRLPLDKRAPLMSPAERSARSPSPTSSGRSSRIDNGLLHTYDMLLDRKMPPSILVNGNYDVLHVFGGAERYLRSQGGRPSNNLVDQIDESMKTALTGALQHASSKRRAVRYSGVPTLLDGEQGSVCLVVDPLDDSSPQVNNLLVEFEPMESSSSSSSSSSVASVEDVSVDLDEMGREYVASLESELRFSQENLQATIEEMETSNEELQATNEELTASNEELQSTNEELHSVNEELYTVNAEHQRRLDELARANDDMDNLLATTRVGVLFLDQGLFIRRYTPEMGRLFHLVPHDLGRSIEGFVHHFRHTDIVDDLKEVLERQEEKEVRVQDRGGAYFLLRMLPYHSGGDVSGVVVTLIDIDSLHLAQAELQRFEFMVENSNDLLALLDEQGRFVYVNRAYERQLGHVPGALQSRRLWEIDEEFSAKHYTKLFARSKSESIPPFTTSLRHRDGSTMAVEMSLSGFSSDDGHYFVSSARDISERVALTSRLEEMGRMIEASEDAIVVWDLDDTIISWSAGATKTYGYSADSAIGRSIHELLSSEGNDARSREEIRALLLEEGQWIGELVHETQGGDTLFISSRQQLLTTGSGRKQVLEINRDITAQKNVQHALEQASEAKSSFLANISHELRTPMAAVLGFADILRLESDEPKFQEKIDVIKRNGEYLLALLNDILDLSKIEAGKFELEMAAVEVGEVIEDIHTLMQVRAREEGIPLLFEQGDKVPRRVSADRVRVRQVLVNLIGNALKFTNHGQVCMTTRLNEGVQPARLEFAIEDTGIGMTAEQMETLFIPFTRVTSETARRVGGTGLGLSISKRLAESMGGEIEVQSEPGEGSCFTFSLPVDAEQAACLMSSRPLEPETPKLDGEVPRLDGAHILVADDRRDIWRVIKFYLEEVGATASVVEDGQQAVEAVVRAAGEQRGFDLVLMDIQMPVMTGREAVTELRRLGYAMPIIAVTADAMDGERDVCLGFGCTEYLAKPIDRGALIRLVAAQLDHRGPGSTKDEAKNDRAPLTLLIVDDNADAADALALLAERLGYQAVTAEDGESALEQARDQDPDAVILDLHLPDMHGTEVAKALREGGFEGPLIALSGEIDRATKERSLASGFDLYFTKPTMIEPIVEAIVELLAEPGRRSRSRSG